MSTLEKQIRVAQHRLWLIRWLNHLCWSVMAGALIYALIVLLQRLFDWPLPLLWIGVGTLALSLLASMIWTMATRDSRDAAAAALDKAAGLRERISSGLYCLAQDEPFARAVVSDAERISGLVTVRMHLRLRTPKPLGWTVGSILLAGVMFLITPGLLAATDEHQAPKDVAMEQTRVAVKRKLDALRDITEGAAHLEDLNAKLEAMSKAPGANLQRPDDVRHEAVKKLVAMSDAVKEKRASLKYDALNEMKKMMRGLQAPPNERNAADRLTRALSQSDFKTAQEEAKALREQLATLKSEEDKEMVEQLGKQLESLSKQLEQLARNEQLAQKLEELGIKKEDVERMLQNLKKEDLEQLQKQLQEKGLSQQQIDRLAKQLQQQQMAGQIAQKLAENMKNSASAAQAGQGADAAAGMSAAADQLSELEQLEQEMAQLESAMAALDSAREDMGSPCSHCQGLGQQSGRPCGSCKGSGGQGGMGDMGQGRGGLAEQQATDVDFKTERGKVHTGKGAIIGQFLVDGEQLKGEASVGFTEVLTASEREASERISRDRIPRQYHRAIRNYFSTMRESVGDGEVPPPTASEDSGDNGSPSDTTEPASPGD